MPNKLFYIILIVASLILSLSISGFSAEEKITITTFYPSPYGSYKELNADSMRIGATYSDITDTMTPNNLVIEGNVGIGTTSPAERIHIIGGNTPRIKIESIVNTSNSSASKPSIDLVRGGPSGDQYTDYRIVNDGGYFKLLPSNDESYTEAKRLIYIHAGLPAGLPIISFGRPDGVGNVGIGTTDPTKKLHVAGEVMAERFYRNYGYQGNNYLEELEFKIREYSIKPDEGTKISNYIYGMGIGAHSYCGLSYVSLPSKGEREGHCAVYIIWSGDTRPAYQPFLSNPFQWVLQRGEKDKCSACCIDFPATSIYVQTTGNWSEWK